MVDYKARELPRKTTTLTLDQQASLFTKIRKTGSNEPYAAILTILAAYHALRSSNIITIKLKDVDIDKRRIYMEDIPDLFLTDIETRIMQEYLKIRKTFHLAEKRSCLFIRQGRGCYEDRSINTRYVNDLVTDYSGYTPKVLRISCLVEMSKLFGPQFLREAYGVSNTHAGRFGKYEDYLLDKTVNDLLTVETR